MTNGIIKGNLWRKTARKDVGGTYNVADYMMSDRWSKSVKASRYVKGHDCLC